MMEEEYEEEEEEEDPDYFFTATFYHCDDYDRYWGKGKRASAVKSIF